jgi:hypothetical protein
MSLNTLEVYEINKKIYVSTQFLSLFFSKSEKQIGRWKKDGLPLATKPKEIPTRGDVFHIDEAQQWVKENINSSKSRATARVGKEIEPPKDGNIDETVTDINGKIAQANRLLQLEGTTIDDADRIKKILDGLIQAVKLGEQTKELIPKRDTEKVIVEFVATLIAGYKRDIKILPKDLKQRSEEEIRKILEMTYKTNIEKYKKIAKSEMLSEDKLYDIIEVALELIQDGASVDKITKRMKSEN